ncbi:MAG: MurR/RpiR family transcriptional regulator [Coprobacillaceae bacterium]
MSILQKLESYQNLTSVEQEVVYYILEHQSQIIDLTISDLASITYTSNATIIRICRKLGMSGYKEFKMQLVKDIERRRKEHYDIDINYPFYKTEKSDDIMKKIADLSIESVNTCYDTISHEDLNQVAKWLLESKDIYLFATGDTLLSAMSFSNRLLKLKMHAIIGSQYGESAVNACNVTKDDVVIFISYSGMNTIDNKYIEIIKRSGCKMILISAASNADDYDIVIKFPDKEASERKVSTYYSQISINYIFNCIYAIIFALNYENNSKNRFR